MQYYMFNQYIDCIQSVVLSHSQRTVHKQEQSKIPKTNKKSRTKTKSISFLTHIQITPIEILKSKMKKELP